MRILHLDPDDMDNPLSGGGPVRTFEIYRRLAERHEVTVLTPTFPGCTREKIRDGIRYIRIGKKIGNHGSSHHITYFLSLPGEILRRKFDILVEDFMPPASATMNPLFTNRPVVASVQWFFAEALSRQYRLPFFFGERLGIRLYRRFVVLTETMKNLILKRHPRAQCYVIPNGVPEELFDIRPEFGDYMLYLGRVDFGQKGVDLLLKALSSIPARKRLPLILAGHTFQFERLSSMLRDLSLENWVNYIGRAGPDQRMELMRSCRFVCVPSREETFGMVITEACASGKPAVIFDRAPMNEVSGPGCLAARPYDVDDYAGQINLLTEATETELMERSQNCKQWAEHFRWDALALRQEDFYRQAYQGKDN